MEKENNIVQKGWTAMTETISGDELVWKTEDGNEYMPDIYKTEKDVWKAIAEDMIQQLKQFINDERELDECDWAPQSYPVRIEIYEDGSLILYEVGRTMVAKEHSIEVKHEILRTTLKEWREGL